MGQLGESEVSSDGEGEERAVVSSRLCRLKIVSFWSSSLVTTLSNLTSLFQGGFMEGE
jgi:hypothetical protein